MASIIGQHSKRNQKKVLLDFEVELSVEIYTLVETIGEVGLVRHSQIMRFPVWAYDPNEALARGKGIAKFMLPANYTVLDGRVVME